MREIIGVSFYSGKSDRVTQSEQSEAVSATAWSDIMEPVLLSIVG